MRYYLTYFKKVKNYLIVLHNNNIALETKFNTLHSIFGIPTWY